MGEGLCWTGSLSRSTGVRVGMGRTKSSIHFPLTYEIPFPSYLYLPLMPQKWKSGKLWISTSLAVGTEVNFPLVYQQLLQWCQGWYLVVVSLGPGQMVTRMSIEVTVSDRIGYIHILSLRVSCLCTNTHTSMSVALWDNHHTGLPWMGHLHLGFPSTLSSLPRSLHIKITRGNAWTRKFLAYKLGLIIANCEISKCIKFQIITSFVKKIDCSKGFWVSSMK